MVDLDALERLRPCGRLETFATARHHLSLYKNIARAATYTLSTRSPAPSLPLQSLVYRALAKVIARHPILSAIPLGEEKSFPDVYFARLPSIHLWMCVEFIPRKGKEEVGDGERDEELEAVIQEQHCRDFKDGLGTKPFWRLVVLHPKDAPEKARSFTAVWVYHHAIADGSSGLVFHRHFLESLQSASTDRDATASEIATTVQSPDAPLLPAFEDLHPATLSPFFILKAVLASIFPRWFDARPTKLWTGGRVSNDPSNLQIQLRTLVLSAATTQRLRDLSRAHETTVTASLQCVIASAVLSNLETADFDKVRADGAISLRKYIRRQGASVEDELLDQLAQYGYEHSRAPAAGFASPESTAPAGSSFSWDEARVVRAEIVKEVNKKGHNNVVSLFRYVPDMHKYLLGQIGKERSKSFDMSNIGVYRREDGTGGWRIERMVSSQCPNVTGSAFATNVITGGDGCAVLAFTWYEGIVESAFMEKVLKAVVKEVDALVREER